MEGLGDLTLCPKVLEEVRVSQLALSEQLPAGASRYLWSSLCSSGTASFTREPLVLEAPTRSSVAFTLTQ